MPVQGRVRAQAREWVPERSRQAVSKAGESKGRAHLHTPCTIPTASVQDGQRVHGAMVTLEHAREVMNKHIKCLFRGFSWNGHERVSVGVYAHTGE